MHELPEKKEKKKIRKVKLEVQVEAPSKRK